MEIDWGIVIAMIILFPFICWADKDKWKRDQDREERKQQEFIDKIFEKGKYAKRK